MITREDLRQLQSITQVPALAILLPTHRSFQQTDRTFSIANYQRVALILRYCSIAIEV